MLIDMNGPDFLRIQQKATTRSADPLDPDVIFSGAFDDGQGFVYQVAVDASGVANLKSYTVSFPSAFAHSPIVQGTLKLSSALVQAGQTIFNAGEYVTPCGYREQRSGKLPTYDYRFSFVVFPDRILVSVSGMTGTVTLLVLETD